jgi:hypothetical protein
MSAGRTFYITKYMLTMVEIYRVYKIWCNEDTKDKRYPFNLTPLKNGHLNILYIQIYHLHFMAFEPIFI